MSAVTLSDVARRAGVSQPTASRVLNGSTRKPAAHVVEAVRKAAAELGYIPNAQAQALARSATGLLGLLVHDIADPYFSAIASGVQRAAAGQQRQVLLSVTSRSPAQELAAVAAFVAHRTDAIIMVGSRWATPDAADIADQLNSVLTRYKVNGGRLAVVGQPIPGASAVVPDNRGAAAALADALVAGGLREFVVLGGPDGLVTAADRTAGFCAALAGHGRQPRAVLHDAFTRDGGYAAARRAIAEVLPAAPGPVCFFAVNDVMALGAMTALREAGLSVPRDAQVAGFDDIPTLRDHHPGLTTVRLPLPAMGEQAVALTIGNVAGRLRVRTVSGQVVLRESTAPAG
jgi:LacI family transcriptional regulator